LIEIYGYYGLFTLTRNTHGGGELLKTMGLEREEVFLAIFEVL